METQKLTEQNVMNNETKDEIELIKSLEGCYTLKSPYHANKRLPFNILGRSFGEFNVEVYTVEYRGKKKNDVRTQYRLSDVQNMIATGLIKFKGELL